jgi:hypothetical protein
VHGAQAGVGELYEDAGDGFQYESGEWARSQVRCQSSPELIDIRLEERHGHFPSRSSSIELELRGVDAAREVHVDGRPLQDWDHADNTIRIRLPHTAAGRNVRIFL